MKVAEVMAPKTGAVRRGAGLVVRSTEHSGWRLTWIPGYAAQKPRGVSVVGMPRQQVIENAGGRAEFAHQG